MNDPRALRFRYDRVRDVLTIEGVEYSGDFFRTLGHHGLALETPFAITHRDANAPISIRTLGPHELARAKPTCKGSTCSGCEDPGCAWFALRLVPA